MEDISEKQGYLYKEVIEAGYNPEAFQEFIIAQNPKKGMDLTKWSMNQLKIITTKFKAQVDGNKQKINSQVSQIKQETAQQSPSKRTQTIVLNSKQQEYYKKMEIYKIKGEFIPEDTTVVMDAFQKKEGGIFEQSYVVYQVKTEALKSCVMRRYSDFQWLRQSFEVFYPGMPIPPIAKKGKLKRKDDKHLIKRMYILQKFVNKVIQIPELRASVLLFKFLTLKDAKDLQNQKTKTKKLKNVPIQKLQNISGELQFRIDSVTNGYISKTHKYLQAIQPEVKRIYKDFKGAATMLEGCAAYMSNLAGNCKLLSKNLVNYRKQCEIPQKKNNVFSCIADMTSRYGQLMLQQAKVFRKQMYSMVKYESFCMIGMIQTLDKLAQMQNTYNQHKNQLYKKKQKLFYEGNLSKWGTVQKITVKPDRDQAFEIMLPKQTKQILRQRDIYALYNYQAYKQIQRSMRQNDVKLSKYFDQILKLLSSISSRSIMIWADVLTGANDITVISTGPPT